MTLLAALWQTARPRQWVKNLLVLAPLAFSGNLCDRRLLVASIQTMICFCLASSGIYCLNDLLDQRLDRFHPIKKHRPIASGRLPRPYALGLAFGLLVIAVGLGASIDDRVGLLLIGYVALMVVYSVVLKRVVIVDVLALSMGFVLRIWAGAITSIPLSSWMQLTVFFLALFVSLAKRRQELVTLHGKALSHRKVLAEYTPAYLDQLTSLTGAMALMAFALYSISPDVTRRVGPLGFLPAIPPALYGIFRYLFLMHVRQGALDPTEALLSDWPMQLSVALWISWIALSLYR